MLASYLIINIIRDNFD